MDSLVPHCIPVGTCIFCGINKSQLERNKGYCTNCEKDNVSGHPGRIYPKCGKCKYFHAPVISDIVS